MKFIVMLVAFTFAACAAAVPVPPKQDTNVACPSIFGDFRATAWAWLAARFRRG